MAAAIAVEAVISPLIAIGMVHHPLTAILE